MALLIFEDDVKYFPRLFKRDSSNKILLFTIKVEGDAGSATIIRKWGQLLGKHQVKTLTLKEGKNLGKSNATNAWTQAVADAQSDWNAKIADGYVSIESLGGTSHSDTDVYYFIGDTDNKGKVIIKLTILNNYLLEVLPYASELQGMFLPMLLHHYRLPSYVKGSNEYKKSHEVIYSPNDGKHEYPVLTQPKKDGICTLATPELGLWTRGGKASLAPNGTSWNDCCPQIAKAIKQLNCQFPLQGETYKHGLSFQEIQSACKKPNKNSTKLELWIFDIVSLDWEYKQRWEVLLELEEQIGKLGLYNTLKIMPSKWASTPAHILQDEEYYLSEGFEGIIIRKPNGLYKPDNRSYDVLKLVREDSDEFIITDVIPMEDDPNCGKFICRTKDGQVFTVNPSMFTHPQRKHLLKNSKSYLGKMLTVKYRGTTDVGIPRFAQGVSIRGNF